MKKIFQIASYDFKRLIFNPISLVVMIVVLIACLIFSATYKIPTKEEYVASTSGEYTIEVYNNFLSSNSDIDTKSSLDALLEEAKNYLEVQSSLICEEYNTFKDIIDSFMTSGGIKDELSKYALSPSNSTYIENLNISQITNAVENLVQFVEDYKSLDAFESKLFFKTSTFETLETIAEDFDVAIKSGTTDNVEGITTILDNLVVNIDKIDQLNTVFEEVSTWQIDAEKLEAFQTEYITKAEEKLKEISAEIEKLSANVTSYDTNHLSEMVSLITNYKLTCESAKYGIQYELYLLLNNHFNDVKNLYKYEYFEDEELEVALAKMNFFLNDESVYYTEYQVPLNFNISSSETTAYDATYTTISIIGFFTIIFGIFCAYKLFGLDRRNGKMDIVLSQNVTFGQVFAGKFFAIVFATSFILAIFTLMILLWSILFFPLLSGNILAVFNLSSTYTIHPFLFLLIKVIGIELEVIFYAVITIFIMNLSRKFELGFGISLGIFAVATICNIFLNGTFVYCLLPFIHANITSMLGGGTLNAGFLQTALYASGNFFISLAYYTVVVVLLYNFTNQLFKKN